MHREVTYSQPSPPSSRPSRRCYLSDDDDIGVGSGEDATLPWVLSPSHRGRAEDEEALYAGESKKTAKMAKETPSSQTKPLALSSSRRNHGRGSTSSRGDPFSMGRFSTAEDGLEKDTDSEDGGSDDGSDGQDGYSSVSESDGEKYSHFSSLL